MEVSDQIWLKQLIRYDDSGVKLLFEQYYIPLVLFARSYVRDVDVARDVVQDVFMAMIQAREKFVTIENLKTYLYSAVKNRSLKYLRHEDVKERYCRYVLKNEEKEEDYANKILEEEVFALLKKSVNELPEQCRNVYILALEGKGNAEIAEVLNIGVETVKSHKKAGKRILFNKLSPFISILFFSSHWNKYFS